MPAAFSATPLGEDPTLMVARIVLVAVLITDTVPALLLVT